MDRKSGADVALSLRSAQTRTFLTSTNALLAYLALGNFVGHMLVANNYGYFRDELYYLAAGRHLAFGYVDFPPLIAFLAALMDLLTRDNLLGIHVISALAAACLTVVSGLMARELGGGRFAQVLAALASTFTVVFMATGSIFSMDVLDTLWWSLGAYVLIRLLRRNQPRLWLVFGLVAGIGLLTKLTILFFGFGVVVGLLLTPQRAHFRTKWPWLGGAIAALFALPYALWNLVNGLPTVEFWGHYGGLTGGGPISFFATQLFTINPFMIPMVIAGLVFYFRTPEGKLFRALGWTYVVLYVVLTLINAKAYFLAPAYPILYAGGAQVFERALAARPRWRWVGPAYASVMIVSGLLLAPLAMPVLPPAAFASHYGFLTGSGNAGAGQSNAGTFPQYLGDRFGWDTMTATVAKVYDGLPPTEQAQTCIFTTNYGEASALSLLGGRYHLPPVISGHNNYFLWGPGSCSGKVVITVGQTLADNQQSFGSVVQAATITCAYCMANENDVPVYICTQPKGDVRTIWPRVKHFN